MKTRIHTYIFLLALQHLKHIIWESSLYIFSPCLSLLNHKLWSCSKFIVSATSWMQRVVLRGQDVLMLIKLLLLLLLLMVMMMRRMMMFRMLLKMMICWRWCFWCCWWQWCYWKRSCWWWGCCWCWQLLLLHSCFISIVNYFFVHIQHNPLFWSPTKSCGLLNCINN